MILIRELPRLKLLYREIEQELICEIFGNITIGDEKRNPEAISDNGTLTTRTIPLINADRIQRSSAFVSALSACHSFPLV